MPLWQSALRFGLVGVSNTVLGLAVIWLAWRWWGWADLPANVLGYAVGFVWSFFAHRHWTFGRPAGRAERHLLRYALVCAAAYAMNLLVLHAARAWAGPQPFWPHVLAMVAYTAVSFTGSRFFAFKESPPCSTRSARSSR
jgi:putative flippase GtrA